METRLPSNLLLCQLSRAIKAAKLIFQSLFPFELVLFPVSHLLKPLPQRYLLINCQFLGS